MCSYGGGFMVKLIPVTVLRSGSSSHVFELITLLIDQFETS